MRRFVDELKDFSKKGDVILLVLCWIVAAFGLVIISSATQAPKYGGNVRYVVVQLVSIGFGTLMYIVFSSIDLELLSEYRLLMVTFNCLMLLMLLTPRELTMILVTVAGLISELSTYSLRKYVK